MKNQYRIFFIFFLLILFIPVPFLYSDDWPTYLHDKERSSVTTETLTPPLTEDWVYRSRHAPAPAWPPPAKHDFHWHHNYNLQPRVTYDHAQHIVSSEGLVYFGSSADDKVYCLDASTGNERWTFFTEGPVRLAPTIYDGAVYVGSDDGYVYCLDAKSGTLRWKYTPAERDYRIPGNERIISLWPVRSGVLIHNDSAFFCAGFFPEQGVYFVTLDAKTGSEVKKEQIGISSQGYLVVKDGKLFTPSGRADPATITELAGGTKDSLLPDQPEDYPYALICAGKTVYAGGDNKIAAFTVDGGQEVWSADIEGKALSMIVSDGKLLVSTDTGFIYCFTRNAESKGGTAKQAYTLTPYPQDSLTATYSGAAQQIVERTGIRQGYCLVIDCGEGRLAYELARQTDLKIIGIEEDADKVKNGRKMLEEAGFYGRVVIHHGSPGRLPYGNFLFNLIVSDQTISEGKLPDTGSEVLRVLRPCGGTIYIGQPDGVSEKLSEKDIKHWMKRTLIDNWEVSRDNGFWVTMRRGMLPGSGQWNHQYADAANTACSNDKLMSNDMQMQWFGRPGPYYMLDRHSRPHAPLSTNGRMFVMGDKKLFGIDAFNGTILWMSDIQEIETRVNIFRDGGFMTADDDYLYIAVRETCRRINAASGEETGRYTLAQPSKIPVRDVYDWGYVASSDDMIFGSGVRKGSFFTDARGPWYDGSRVTYVGTQVMGSTALSEWQNAKVCSDFLFAVEKDSGNILWKYDGLIINTAIAIGDGTVFFVENRNKLLADNSDFFLRRINVPELWEDTYLVAVNARTGEKQWDQKVSFVPGKIVFYLAYAHDTVIAVSSPYTHYQVYAFNAEDGKLLWEKNSKYRVENPDRYDHGVHLQHPVIIDDVIFQEPLSYSLKNGEQYGVAVNRAGGGCGSLSAASGFIFGRKDNPYMYDLGNKGDEIPLTKTTRTGCWINMIPANGLLLIPEASSGCSCNHPVQTSMAFVSKNLSGLEVK